jgi:hypothetical protein
VWGGGSLPESSARVLCLLGNPEVRRNLKSMLSMQAYSFLLMKIFFYMKNLSLSRKPRVFVPNAAIFVDV